ncbi:MAG: PKD domain-containing protein [Bacteroidia bacterium]|nr:PKD domain-containing protein [Bacteroidia bacterium]
MKRKLHLNRTVLIALMMMAVFANSGKASHTMGADLTYECLGGNTYRVTVSFYRDCIGIPAPANPYVSIISPSCGQSLGVTVYPRPGTGQEVTPSCSSSVTTCSGGSFTGIQEWVYDGIITLPMQCADWTFSYSLCCRNAAITTITNPGTSTFYIYSTLNNLITPCNSSPTFTNKPVPFLCLGQQYCFNHGAYDPDGDSLVYELITPKQTAGADVNYMAPYNASNPLNSIPGTTFNTVTGDICLNPQNLEVTVMAVLVKEFRNGVQIGSVERDLQLTVMNCANNLPSLTGINGTTDFSITICANEPTCFDIFSIDPDIGQNLQVSWDAGIPGATFTTTSAARPTGTFCWTPSSSDIGNSYIFTVRVIDDACPYYGTQIYSYTVNVIGITVNAGPDQDIACSDFATLNASASGGSGSYTYLWSNGATTPWITVGAGTYWVTANDGTCSATDTVVVRMPYIPVAAFTHTTTTCVNVPIIFTDQSTTPGGIIIGWNWNFDDGTSSTLQNPTHLFPGAGTYDVRLIIENTLGCFDTIIHQIIIDNPPVAAFTFSNACVGTTVSFTDQSTPPGTTTFWNWNFGDGTSSTLQNPSHTYSTIGSYGVTLITGNASGCIDTLSQIVTINPLPIISAGADQTICAGSSATLTAGGGTTYTWIPGGSTLPSIVVNPSGSGSYVVVGTDANGCINSDTVWVNINPLPAVSAGPDVTSCSASPVTLTASGATSYTWLPGGQTGTTIVVNPSGSTSYTVIGTGANGCTASDVVTVNVNSLPIAVAGADQNICAGSSATLTASGGGTYTWSPGGSTSSTITITPGSTSTYIVTVTNGAGCSAMDSVQIIVHDPPAVVLAPVFLCTGSTATLDAGVAGSTYLWTPTGETTQTITISTGGTYGVTVTDAYGCTANASANVTMGTSININLDDVSFCQGDSAVLDAGYSGLIYLWSTGATTQSITVYTAGTYGVTVDDNSGCTGSITVNAQISPIPVANFNTTSVCAGTATSFTDASTISSNVITNWTWDFGDATGSTDQNPTHIYTTAGTYTVQLTVASADGCSHTVTNNVVVNPLPVADFTSGGSCLGASVSFTNTSTVASGIITSYNWNFGDTNTSTSQHPSHTYAAAGNYTVNLQVTTAGGCTNAISYPVTVNPLPVAAFSAAAVCSGSGSSFINTSSISTGSIASYSWDFGDTYSSTIASPGHIYAGPGTYSVRLIATSGLGCTDTLTNSVIVHAPPVANAGSDQTMCNGLGVTLNASGGVSYVWTPGGSTSNNIAVNPTSNSIYTLTATDANGCTDNDIVNVYVHPMPAISAGPDRILCSGSSATLTASGGVSYTWFPGGSTATSISVNPVINSTYYLTGTDANGCVVSDTVNVVVNPLPNINAGPDFPICSGSTVSLTATGAAAYSWNPGAATTSTILVSPLVTTSYIVTGTNADGCQRRDTITVSVNPIPVVSLSPSFICPGFMTTLNAGNPGATFAWSTGETSQTINVNDSGTYTVVVTSANGCNAMGTSIVTLGNTLNSTPVTSAICFGDSATLQAGNPGSTYSWSTGSTNSSITATSAGNYSVIITDANGCTGTLMHVLNVNPIPVAAFSSNPNCEGNATVFTNLSTISSGTIQSYNWDFGDLSSSNNSAPTHNYASAGSFPISLTITSATGCTNTTTGVAVIHPKPVASFSSNSVCEGLSSVFTDASNVSTGNITSWTWNFGDGNSSSGNSANHIYSSNGNYQTTLIVTTDQGCTDTIQQNVTVYMLPTAGLTASDACANSIIQFNNTSVNGSGTIQSYSWNFGNGNSSSLTDPTNSYTSDGSYSVILTVTSSLGCVDTSALNLNIHPLPVTNFSTLSACANTGVSFNNTTGISSGSISTYYWDFGDNSSSNLQLPTHAYASEGSYSISLIATSNHGCRDTAQNNLVIHPIPVATFTAQNVCEGAPLEFLNISSISTGSISAWSWDFGDGTASTLEEPVHIYSAAGSYPVILTVSSTNGCSNSVTANVNIYPNPSAAFVSGNVCLGNGNLFLNQSDVAGGIAFSSLWTFSDGTTSTVTSPTHVFASSGMYSIQLAVTSIHGCISQATRTTQIYLPPTTLFSANDVCQGGVTHFDDNSYSQDGQIATWLWNFGDGSMSTEGNPTHVYQGAGEFNVQLTTTSSFGCSSPFADTVAIYARPTSRIQTANVCEGLPVMFVNNSINNTGTTLSFLWDLGNGFTSSDSAFTYNFVQPGTYDVTLTATSSYGCSDTQLERLSVYPKPRVNFAGSDACLNSGTSFANQTAILSGSIQSYQWSFGDGSNSSQVNAIHSYSSPGTYQVNLTATSDNGCVHTNSSEVVVHPNPTVQFAAAYQGCAPLQANFNDNSVITTGTISGWLWNFGDGNISTDQHAHHVFTQGGNYDVSLTVVSDFGCQASYTNSGSIRVYGQPIANFTADPLIGDNISPTVHFTNLSQGFSSYQWNFGDGSATSTIFNPVHTFSDTGSYSAQLITVNVHGCRDTLMRTIEIRPRSTLFAPNCFTPNGDGHNDAFRPYFTNMTNIQVWIFDRWGLMLTNWEGLEGNWDGYYHGAKCQQDTYVYKIKGIGVDGKFSEWVGHVSIVY